MIASIFGDLWDWLENLEWTANAMGLSFGITESIWLILPKKKKLKIFFKDSFKKKIKSLKVQN